MRRFGASFALITSIATAAADTTSRVCRGASSARKIVVERRRFYSSRRANLAHPSDVVKCVLSLCLFSFFSISLSFSSPFPLPVCLSASSSLLASLPLFVSPFFSCSLASFVPCILYLCKCIFCKAPGDDVVGGGLDRVPRPLPAVRPSPVRARQMPPAGREQDRAVWAAAGCGVLARAQHSSKFVQNLVLNAESKFVYRVYLFTRKDAVDKLLKHGSSWRKRK